MTSWSEEDFQRRVADRCVELGRSKRSVLQAAGLAHDFLQSAPQHGRRIDNLEKLALALDWSLAEIIGITPADGSIEMATMQLAYRSMQRVTQSISRHDEQTTVWVLSMLYNLLHEYANPGIGFDDYIAYVEQRVQWLLVNPDFVESVERKIQRFQQGAVTTKNAKIDL